MPQHLPVTDRVESGQVQPVASDMQAALALQGELAALRADGAHRLDPVRFCYLESLSARLAATPPAVRRILIARLSDALGHYRARPGPAPTVVEVPEAKGPVRPFALVYAQRRAAAAQGLRPGTVGRHLETDLSAVPAEAQWAPLVELNRYINQTARQGLNSVAMQAGEVLHGDRDGVTGEAATWAGVRMDAPGHHRVELKSARRFGETWSKLQSANLVEQAILNGPENAGPFNPHMLMVRSLALMRELSPDYLHRFIQHADTLLWLEQASVRHTPLPNRPKVAKPPRARK